VLFLKGIMLKYWCIPVQIGNQIARRMFKLFDGVPQFLKLLKHVVQQAANYASLLLFLVSHWNKPAPFTGHLTQLFP